jgi:hypothetical protein
VRVRTAAAAILDERAAAVARVGFASPPAAAPVGLPSAATVAGGASAIGLPATGTVAAAPAPGQSRRGVATAIVAAILGLIGVVLNGIGLYVIGTDSLGDDWFTDFSYILAAAAGIAVLSTRQRRWTAMLAGLISWEWLLPTILGHDRTRDILGSGWGSVVAANLFGLVATVFAVISLLRGAALVRGATWRRVVAGLVVLPLAVATCIAGTVMLVDVFGTGQQDDTSVRIVLAMVCAAIVPLFALLAPTSQVTRYVLVGWLLSGAQIVLIGASQLGGGDLADEPTSMMVLLLVTAIAAVVTIWHRAGGGPTPAG